MPELKKGTLAVSSSLVKRSITLPEASSMAINKQHRVRTTSLKPIVITAVELNE